MRMQVIDGFNFELREIGSEFASIGSLGSTISRSDSSSHRAQQNDIAPRRKRWRKGAIRKRAAEAVIVFGHRNKARLWEGLLYPLSASVAPGTAQLSSCIPFSRQNNEEKAASWRPALSACRKCGCTTSFRGGMGLSLSGIYVPPSAETSESASINSARSTATPRTCCPPPALPLGNILFVLPNHSSRTHPLPRRPHSVPSLTSYDAPLPASTSARPHLPDFDDRASPKPTLTVGSAVPLTSISLQAAAAFLVWVTLKATSSWAPRWIGQCGHGRDGGRGDQARLGRRIKSAQDPPPREKRGRFLRSSESEEEEEEEAGRSGRAQYGEEGKGGGGASDPRKVRVEGKKRSSSRRRVELRRRAAAFSGRWLRSQAGNGSWTPGRSGRFRLGRGGRTRASAVDGAVWLPRLSRHSQPLAQRLASEVDDEQTSAMDTLNVTKAELINLTSVVDQLDRRQHLDRCCTAQEIMRWRIGLVAIGCHSKHMSVPAQAMDSACSS
ncbi:uncharacterized protein MKK02DRAFT_27890 [Dioszegia hungarica]|uniref:Uncharacterized protein n=1 Tax=Dioszegia hungarica TaxID=4972 RepID=A0AA38H6Z3_9TREE|nr:uncharacterized protein MKK02DRAFT_27890 [Dioszegia hungarica]KAI9634731.1 hypothetical protein MKK02DRAFT_27890 [Dioszegia hungarica]